MRTGQIGVALRQFPADGAPYRAVTARRSDGPDDCRNNTGWRCFGLNAAYMTKP
jgi:hypothetical protein